MKETISVSSEFFKDCIWMSIRYCIGRHTITASTHPDGVIKYVKHLSKKEREFLSDDIRREISECYRFSSNIYIEGFSYKYDAFTLLVDYMIDKDLDFKSNKFSINVDTGDVKHEPFESVEKYIRNPIDDLVDMIGWSRLAQYLNEEFKTVTIDYEGETKDIECIETFLYNYNDKKPTKIYMSKEHCLRAITNNFHINEQYITNIK